MSSNIKIQRVCQYCGDAFIAKTTVTKYCSHKCSSRSHKERLRGQKITNATTEFNPSIVYDQDFLSVADAAVLLNVSRWSIYRYLSANLIPCKRFGGKTFIRRLDIETLFDKAEVYEKRESKSRKPITEFYTIGEIMDAYACKQSYIYRIVKERNIPKVILLGKAYYSKRHIDKAFARKISDPAIMEWYSVEDIKEKFGLSLNAIYSFVYERNIPKKKEGKYTLYSKTHFNAAKGYSEPQPDYYTIEEAMTKFGLSRDSLYRYISINTISKIKCNSHDLI